MTHGCRRVRNCAELAQRVECIGVEEIRCALRHRLALCPDHLSKSPHRIASRPAGIMLAKPRQRGSANGVALQRLPIEANKFDVREENVIALLLRQLGEHAVIVLAVECEEPGIVEIFELSRRGIDAVDRDRRLRVLAPVRDAARIGEVESVDFY